MTYSSNQVRTSADTPTKPRHMRRFNMDMYTCSWSVGLILSPTFAICDEFYAAAAVGLVHTAEAYFDLQ